MDAAPPLVHLREGVVVFRDREQRPLVRTQAVTSTLALRSPDKHAMTSIAGVGSGGFTLIELVVTLVIMGVLSAVVIANMNAQSKHSATAQADQLRRDISHIQFLAISQDRRFRLSVASTGSSYTVYFCDTPTSCPTTNTVTDPATGQNFSVTLTDGVTLSPAPDNLDFDSLGRPQSGGNLISNNPARTYALTGGGSNHNVTVTVLPITGFAQTTY